MFGGQDGLRRMMGGEQLKPKNIGETLGRLGTYFKPYWLALVFVALLIITSTWTQVTNPDLIGQAVDCYLAPAVAGGFNIPGAPAAVASSQSNCWLGADPASLSLTQRTLQSVFTSGGFPRPTPTATDVTEADRLAGLGRLIAVIIGLFIAGSLLTGLTFFTMSWTGQKVLRALRVDVFQHLHRLSLSYYAEHEAGDLMSRITSDSETINQALSFALINVLGGVLLIVWLAYSMLVKSVPFALLSLVVGNFVLFYTYAYVCVRRSYVELTRFTLLAPVYWVLMSIGAWVGLLSLIRNPFYWAKTEHGVSLAGTSTRRSRWAASDGSARRFLSSKERMLRRSAASSRPNSVV